jgi:pyruvate carboxylase subunit B
MVRKGENKDCGDGEMSGNYTVVEDGKQYSVQVAEGDADIQVTPTTTTPVATATPAPVAGGKGTEEILSQTPGNVWKITKSVGDSVNEGDTIMILEAMKMEIDVVATRAGTIRSIEVNTNDAVSDGQLLATMD